MLLATVFAVFSVRCSEPEEAPAIRILAPEAGRVFKLADTVRIITECDYTRFASGITIRFSPDSAKTWQIIRSLVRKEGKEKDTLAWIPQEEHPADVAAGTRLLFEVYDYSRKFITQSGYVTFTN